MDGYSFPIVGLSIGGLPTVKPFKGPLGKDLWQSERRRAGYCDSLRFHEFFTVAHRIVHTSIDVEL